MIRFAGEFRVIETKPSFAFEDVLTVISLTKAPSDAEFRHKIKPTKDLLFRFSALTFNAHSIHLDTSYTQNVEGYPALLVHGPLTLTLLLTVLQSYLVESNRAIREIEYRNLCPLYVDEDLTICGKPRADKGSGAWDIWIEGHNGGLAVRGTVKTDNCINLREDRRDQ